MPPRKPVSSLWDIAMKAVQKLVFYCLTATVEDLRNGLPSLLDERVKSLYTSVFNILPPISAIEVLQCLRMPHSGTRCVQGGTDWEKEAYYLKSLEFLARLCEAGVAMEKITVTKKWLLRILANENRLGRTFTDLTVAPEHWDDVFITLSISDGALVDASYPNWLPTVASQCPRLRRLQVVFCPFHKDTFWGDYPRQHPWPNSELALLFELCPDLEHLELGELRSAHIYADRRLLVGLSKLKTFGKCDYTEIALLINSLPTGTDFALEKIRADFVSAETQRIIFGRCRRIKSVEVTDPSDHLNLCRGLQELLLRDGHLSDLGPAIVGAAATLSYLDLWRINFSDVSQIYVLVEDLPQLRKLQLSNCSFSKEICEEEERLNIKKEDSKQLFPKLQYLIMTNKPISSQGLMPLKVVSFLMAAAKDLTHLQLDQAALTDLIRCLQLDQAVDAAECLRKVTVEEGGLRKLKKLVTIMDVNFNVADFDLLLDLCPGLTSLGPLKYWKGLSEAERAACERRVKDNNLDLDLFPSSLEQSNPLVKMIRGMP